MKEKQPTPVTIEALCGNCAYWNKIAPQGPVEIGAPGRGVCVLLPPTPVPRVDSMGRFISQGHCRPMPMEGEMCGQFVPRADLLPPEAFNA